MRASNTSRRRRQECTLRSARGPPGPRLPASSGTSESQSSRERNACGTVRRERGGGQARVAAAAGMRGVMSTAAGSVARGHRSAVQVQCAAHVFARGLQHSCEVLQLSVHVVQAGGPQHALDHGLHRAAQSDAAARAGRHAGVARVRRRGGDWPWMPHFGQQEGVATLPSGLFSTQAAGLERGRLEIGGGVWPRKGLILLWSRVRWDCGTLGTARGGKRAGPKLAARARPLLRAPRRAPAPCASLLGAHPAATSRVLPCNCTRHTR